MKRDIKFRAWDKVNKCMKVVSELDFLYEKSQKMTWGMQGSTTDVWLNGEDESYFPSDVVILQFSGCHAKNDDEIYDRDILKSDIYPNNLLKVEYRDNYSSFGAYPIRKGYSGVINLGILDLNHYEVIGNIYENPELLEQIQ